LTLSNIIVGLKTLTIRTPFQPYAIVVTSCLIVITFQGIQIDTEHWRHYYWMIGLIWGMFAASAIYVRSPATPEEIAGGWNIILPSNLRQA
jgi:hypothetical protein